MDASFTVLKLGAPTSVDRDAGLQLPAAGARTSAASASASQYNDSYPPSSIIHLTFPARGDLPPVKLHWYDGGLLPERPEDLEPERQMPESGTIFVGDKGKMWCETYSESPRLIPESAMQAFQRPPKTLPRVPDGRAGHEKNWLDAIRQKGQAVSHFDYAGRSPRRCCSATSRCASPARGSCGMRPNMKVTNVPEADQYVQHTYRQAGRLTTSAC